MWYNKHLLSTIGTQQGLQTLAAESKQLAPLPVHGVAATTAMDAKETWPARRRRLDPSLKTSPPNNAQTFSTGASSSSSSSSIAMTMVCVSVNTKSTTTSIATTSANYFTATMTYAALAAAAALAHVGANRLS